MRKEVLELDERFGKEFAGRYVFQEISWAKRSRIIQKYTKYYPLTGQFQNSDFVAIQAETIWGSLREQPPDKPISFEKLLSENNGIPIEVSAHAIDYGNTPLLPDDTTHVTLPNENVDADFRTLRAEYHLNAKAQTLEITLELGREQPLLADYLYALRSKTDHLS